MAIYYKETTTKEQFLLLKENPYTNARFGYFVSDDLVYFYDLFKNWEKSYNLKYYKSNKGNYINFHGKRLYFDIKEREQKTLVRVEVEGGREK